MLLLSLSEEEEAAKARGLRVEGKEWVVEEGIIFLVWRGWVCACVCVRVVCKEGLLSCCCWGGVGRTKACVCLQLEEEEKARRRRVRSEVYGVLLLLQFLFMMARVSNQWPFLPCVGVHVYVCESRDQ